MAGAFGLVALNGFFLALAAAVTITLLGLYVVRKHPRQYDPARNAKRYTRPALVLVILLALGIIAVVIGLIGAGVAILTT